MSQFDMVSKRAERLLRKNWVSVVAEAHRLGSLGLPGLKIFVEDTFVRLEVYPTDGRGLDVVIGNDGEISGTETIQWQDGHWESDRGSIPRSELSAVEEILRLALEDAKNRASEMGQVAQKMAEVR